MIIARIGLEGKADWDSKFDEVIMIIACFEVIEPVGPADPGVKEAAPGRRCPARSTKYLAMIKILLCLP